MSTISEKLEKIKLLSSLKANKDLSESVKREVEELRADGNRRDDFDKKMDRLVKVIEEKESTISPIVNVTVPEIKMSDIVFPEYPPIVIPEIKLPVINVPKPEIKVVQAPAPVVNIPEFPSLNPVTKELREIKEIVSIVREPKKEHSVTDPLPVRLSDGEKFIDSLVTAVTTPTLVGGGGNVPKVTVSGGQQAVIVANPDGSNVGTSDVDVSTSTTYTKKYYTNSGAVTDGIIWSPAASKRWNITTIYIQTSADATMTLEDDLVAGDSPIWKGEIAAKSGAVINFDAQYPWASGEDGADLLITTSAGNCYITVVGYEI